MAPTYDSLNVNGILSGKVMPKQSPGSNMELDNTKMIVAWLSCWSICFAFYLESLTQNKYANENYCFFFDIADLYTHSWLVAQEVLEPSI